VTGGLGHAAQSIAETLEHVKDARVKILVSLHFDAKQEHVVRIPGWDAETQNYVAACDLVVSKCGYNTIPEASRAQVPLFVFRRDGFAEDAFFIDGVTDYGLGNEISRDAFREGEFFKNRSRETLWTIVLICRDVLFLSMVVMTSSPHSRRCYDDILG